MTIGALKMSVRDLASLGRLRLAPGVEVLELNSDLWLRWSDPDESLQTRLAAVPALMRYEVLADQGLRPQGRLAPQGYLPQGDWRPLVDWMQVALPPALFAGELRSRLSLRLVRGGAVQTPNVVLLPATEWQAYAATAPQIRLQRWSFAMSEDRQVIVRGAPAPALPAQALVERDGVAVPAGFCWEPAIEPALLRELLGMAPGDLALFQAGGSYQLIAADAFVQANRSAIHASCRKEGEL